MQFAIPLSPAIIAILPPLLELVEQVLDRVGILGGHYIEQRLKTDTRPIIKNTFVLAANGTDVLNAIGTYFNFDATAGDIIKFHLAYLISIYVEGVSVTHDLFSIRGWPIVAILIVGGSLIIFLIGLIKDKFSPADPDPFPRWGKWTWLLCVVVVGFEAWQHFNEPQAGAS
jgi:hypothetical protein